MDKVLLENYITGEDSTTDMTLPQGVDSFETGYDGGRFYLVINGVTLFTSLNAGSDFSVSAKSGLVYEN